MTSNHQELKSLPENIMLDKWADVGFEWVGAVPVASFERLFKQINMAKDAATLDVKAKLQKQDGILWLTFDVAGALSVSCQRCLEPMSVDVTNEYRLAILANESQIEQVEDAEYVLIDELGAGRMLPLKDLLEDELLLALPLSPRHDDCEMPIEMIEDDDDDEMADNPFAALAALKGKLS